MLLLSAKCSRPLVKLEGRFGQPFKRPIIPFGSLVEYHPFTAKDSQELINLERKSYLDCSLIRSVRGVNLEG